MKLRTFFIILLLAGTVGSGIAAAVLYAQSVEMRRDLEVAAANAEALRDTVTMYEDSVSTTVSLMQTQGQVNEDSIAGLLTSLDLAIDGRSQAIRALNSVRVEFEAYRTSVESSVVVDVPDETEEPGAQEATFQVEGPPIQGDLFVTYRPNLPWGLRTNLMVTPFTQTYTIGCEGHNALVNITNPPWVNATPERGTITPDVCNPIQPVPIISFTIGKAVWAVGGGILGAGLYWLFDELLSSDPSPSYPNYDWQY